MQSIRQALLAAGEEKYQKFQSSLIPNIPEETIIGVRTPKLRAMAKELAKSGDSGTFLNDLPHCYFEENQLHGFLIEQCKDFDRAMEMTERYLPYIDNWATCDQFRPKVFVKRPAEFLGKIESWIQSDHTYTVRYAIGCLMQYYLDERFEARFPAMVAAVQGEDYYIRMMVAWYFATALAKQYDSVIGYLEKGILPLWTHNKTIQKAVESCRITPEQKDYLRSLRRKS